MPDVFATSFGVLNYSGMLFNKGNTRTPLSTMIGGRQKTTNSVEFVVGQYYNTADGEQPAISESASLTAPYASVVTRSQMTNVTQIFQYSVGVSYAKQSNMGTLSGANIANQTANPMNELDFQVAAKMAKAAQDIEYTFINGAYVKAAADDTANKTRGLVAAITTNVIDCGGNPLGYWTVVDALRAIAAGNAPTDGLVVWADPTTMLQLHGDAVANGLTIVPGDRFVNGIRLDRLITPFGDVFLRVGAYLPSGTALLLNLDVLAPVAQPVPGKGNFFLEELAKTGAGAKYQIFGQLGLDHGPEWFHAKLTNISTDFSAPKGKNVVVSGPVGTISTANGIVAVDLDKTGPIAATSKVAVASITYVIPPASDPSVAYLWQKGDTATGTFTDLTSSYTGYNTAELTTKSGDTGKYFRCKVTATGSVAATAYSDAIQVATA